MAKCLIQFGADVIIGKNTVILLFLALWFSLFECSKWPSATPIEGLLFLSLILKTTFGANSF